MLYYRPLRAALTLDPASAAKIHAFMKQQGLVDLVPPEDYHVTTVYSRTPCAYTGHGVTMSGKSAVPHDFQRFGDVLVLTLESECADNLWLAGIRHGASWDYSNYVPHITISRNLNQPVDLETLNAKKSFRYYTLYFREEIVIPLKEPVTPGL